MPAELRPENRTLGKLRSLINGMSPYPEGREIVTDIVKRPEKDEEKENDESHAGPNNGKIIVPENLKTDSNRKGSYSNISSDNLINPNLVEINPVIQEIKSHENNNDSA